MSTKTRRETARIESIGYQCLPEIRPALENAIPALLNGQSAESVVRHHLRQNQQFRAPDRALFAEMLYAVAVWRRRLILHASSTAPKSLIFVLLRDLAQLPVSEAKRLTEWGDQPEPPIVTPQTPADRYSLPDWLWSEILHATSDNKDAEALAQALNFPGAICLRTNLLKTTPDELQAQLASEGVFTQAAPHAPHGLIVTSPRPNILGLPSHQQGLFEVQDEGSQLLGHLLQPLAGESVLDLCAGAGGKTLQLASLMRNQGAIHAFDIHLEKLQRLKHRADRANARIVKIHAQLPENLQVDRVMVDAPCSELGPLRRGPDRRFLIQPNDFQSLPTLQNSLVDTAMSHLRPGGRLVYATCTFRRAENEEVAQAIEHRFPQLKRVTPIEVGMSENFNENGYFHTWPHRHEMDGFFAAVYEYLP